MSCEGPFFKVKHFPGSQPASDAAWRHPSAGPGATGPGATGPSEAGTQQVLNKCCPRSRPLRLQDSLWSRGWRPQALGPAPAAKTVRPASRLLPREAARPLGETPPLGGGGGMNPDSG